MQMDYINLFNFRKSTIKIKTLCIFDCEIPMPEIY